MDQRNPRVLKEREQKYEKLIRMIKGFQRTSQELKLLEKIKSDTVFQISLRYRRCEPNKVYRFPKTAQANETDSDQEENRELLSDKELVYNLHSQNKLKTDPSLERHQIRLQELEEHGSRRRKTEGTSNSNSRVHSLGTEKGRPSRQRIDRIQKLHILVEKQRLRTERGSEKKLRPERSITKIPSMIHKIEQSSKGMTSQTLSSGSSNYISPMKALTVATRKEIFKTEMSPIKLSKSRPKIKLATEQADTSIHRTSQKKVHTEESGTQTVKKGRIHNFLNNEIKKAEKIIILSNMAHSSKLKPKNLFQKQIY